MVAVPVVRAGIRAAGGALRRRRFNNIRPARGLRTAPAARPGVKPAPGARPGRAPAIPDWLPELLGIAFPLAGLLLWAVLNANRGEGEAEGEETIDPTSGPLSSPNAGITVQWRETRKATDILNCSDGSYRFRQNAAGGVVTSYLPYASSVTWLGNLKIPTGYVCETSETTPAFQGPVLNWLDRRDGSTDTLNKTYTGRVRSSGWDDAEDRFWETELIGYWQGNGTGGPSLTVMVPPPLPAPKPDVVQPGPITPEETAPAPLRLLPPIPLPGSVPAAAPGPEGDRVSPGEAPGGAADLASPPVSAQDLLARPVVPDLLPRPRWPGLPLGPGELPKLPEVKAPPKVTGKDDRKVGELLIPAPDRDVVPSLKGIATEVGKIERKVEALMQNKAGPGDTTDLLQLLGQVWELLGASHGAGQYQITSECRVDLAGNPLPPFVAEWTAGNSKLGELEKKIDAIAQLLQLHKDLPTHVCRRPAPEGQRVLVTFNVD